jgi:hypothetical protein
MDQRIRRLIMMAAVALVCLVLVTAPVPAAPRDPLKAASMALSAHLVTTVHLEGFGATYAAHARVPLPSYRADIDLTQDAMSTPQGFLKAARAAQATVRDVPQGAELSFTVNGQAFIGVINPDNEVDRVLTWADVQGRGDTLVETLFRDYEKTPSGVWFPTHITRSQGGQPVLDLWLSSVDIQRRQR